MENKTVTLSRHLALVTLVRNNPGVTLTQLGRVLGRTTQQIRADIDLLDRAGVGDQLPDQTFFFDMDLLERRGEVALTFDLGASGSQPLTADETSRLVVGLAAMGSRQDAADLDQIPQLISKVLALAGPHEVPNFADLARLLSVIDSNKLSKWHQLVETALSDGRELHLTYLSGRSRLSDRTVDPIALLQVPDGWVLNGWCHEAEEERNFRLDRIVFAEMGGPVTVDGRKPSAKRREEQCTVVLSREAQWLLTELPAISTSSAGSELSAVFQVWDDAWITTQLILLSPYIVSVTPNRYLESAAERANQALAVWGAVPGTGER